MGSITTSCASSNMADSHQRQTTSSLAIMLTEESNHSKQSVCFLHTRSNIPKTFLFYEEITNVRASTEYTGFTTNVRLRRIFSVLGLTDCFAGKRRYNIKLWKTFTDCFNCLPIAAIIDEKIFTMHGGLSPDLQSMEQIRRVMRPTDVPDTGLCGSITR